MKKLVTILCATLLSVGVFAQAETEAGTFLLSGTTGFDFGSLGVTGTDPSESWDPPGMPSGYDYSEKSSNMNLKLDGGYCVMDGLAVGLAILYTSGSSTSEESFSGYEESSKNTSSSMIIAPTLRYYFGETGVWLQTAYGFGSMSSEYESESTGSPKVTVESSSPMSVLSLGAGYAISLADNISLNPSLGYAMKSVTTEDGYMNTNGNLEDLKTKSAGLVFAIGITMHLGN